VNSFHRRGIRSRDLAAPLVALALADDEWIEAAISEDPPMLGLMWHPEREERLQRVDATMVRWIFGI
jgi:putative glutamine amidotransferase